MAQIFKKEKEGGFAKSLMTMKMEEMTDSYIPGQRALILPNSTAIIQQVGHIR